MTFIPFINLKDAKVGVVVVADGDFDCISKGEELIIEEDPFGLYVPCSCGKHYLDGQLNDQDNLVGLYSKV